MILSNSPRQTPSFHTFPPINPPVHIPSSQSIGASSSSTNTQSPSSSTQSPSTSTFTQTPIMAGRQQQPPPRPVKPWANLGDVKMLAPLHDLPKQTERRLPKFNPDDGLPAEEHLHNYMLAINLNGVVEEDCVVRLFPYTFEGSTGSWYF